METRPPSSDSPNADNPAAVTTAATSVPQRMKRTPEASVATQAGSAKRSSSGLRRHGDRRPALGAPAAGVGGAEVVAAFPAPDVARCATARVRPAICPLEGVARISERILRAKTGALRQNRARENRDVHLSP